MQSKKTSSCKFTFAAILFFILFAALILAVKLFDVAPIGPENSEIGLSAVNSMFRDFCPLNMMWYDITDLFMLVAIAVVGFFGLEGLFEVFTRKSIKKVDTDILLLGVFYAIVVAFYILFEVFVINYRPVILEGELEASFPSSHTMLVTSVMGTAIYQFFIRIENKFIRSLTILLSVIVILVTVIGRMLSGVHWFTDILGAVFLSCGLIFSYIALNEWLNPTVK